MPCTRALLILFIFGTGYMLTFTDGVQGAILAYLDGYSPCISPSIQQRNGVSSIVLTGTVRSCNKTLRQMYSCTVQVWNVMKGKNLTANIVRLQQGVPVNSIVSKAIVVIHGLGNPTFCESEVKRAQTRVFFLNLVQDRLVLASSLLRITLKNLKNTEQVIRGIDIDETPARAPDPCMLVVCGFGAKCRSSANGTATCVCPTVTCNTSDVFAPVCGSDGVSYPSVCILKAYECWHQKRIRIKSYTQCTPIEHHDPCEDMTCGNAAVCIVVEGVAKCQCRTCDDVDIKPVCGSDQTTYKSECALHRTACILAKEIRVIRRTPCDPCSVYNETSNSMTRVCTGACSWNEIGEPQCCDDIPCQPSRRMMICGSDGRTYMSKCALERYICKTGKNITELSAGSCASGKKSTVIRGSTSIKADEKCPGNCQNNSPEFVDFTHSFEKAVEKELRLKNEEDSGAKAITNFTIDEVRSGSVVFVYSATITWLNDPIEENFTPGQDSNWAYERLHHPSHGVLPSVVEAFGMQPASDHDPTDDSVTEEICGSMQCNYGAACKLTKDESGGLLYDCDCSVVGEYARLAVTLGCKIASNGHFYDNKIAARLASCTRKSFLTFKNSCENSSNLCDAVTCGTGRTCIVTNGVPSCDCITCEADFKPVCGSNGRTYRNRCELDRDRCIDTRHQSLTLLKEGLCETQCRNENCGYGSQCEELPHKSPQCICPTDCIDVYAPVCGSDGYTYENECKMLLASCNKNAEITVLHRNPCDAIDEPEGSGNLKCQFGATYETTSDDESGRCLCSIVCQRSDVTLCGSNGVTYYGECELRKARCTLQQNITVAGIGSCSENCHCNEHGALSSFCNPASGQCVCRPGVTGLQCDECLPGYWNFNALVDKEAVGCTRCSCDRNGANRDDCDQMTGQCTCRDGVTGSKCSMCENQGVLTEDGCVEDVYQHTASSCEALNCRFGAKCSEVEAQSGHYECRCSSLSSCTDFPNKLVCGSNGVTYPNECHMKNIGCRERKTLFVLSEGSCENFFNLFPPTYPNVPTTSTISSTAMDVVPSITTMSAAVTLNPTKSSSTISAASNISQPTDGEEMEGSGDVSHITIAPTDDEDWFNESSGQGPLNDTQESIQNGSMSSYCVQVTFLSADGMELVHSANTLASNPEILAQYKASIQKKIMSIIELIPNHADDDLLALRDIEILRTSNSGASARFLMDISSQTSITELEEFVNGSLPSGETFAILEIDECETTEYAEDGVWNVPQFSGSSFIAFQTIRAYSSVTLELEFKSTDREGLLLYNGRRTGLDFISLAIIDTYVEFRFNTGSGSLSLRSTIPVSDGKWHTLIARRNRREGMLKVDNETERFGTSTSRTTGVNLDTPLFIGGYPYNLADKIKQQTGISKGLTGCIKELKIGQHGTRRLNLQSNSNDIRNSLRIAKCGKSPCMPNPCEHSSKCLITYRLEEFTYKCDCGPRYQGSVCESESPKDACTSNPCHELSTCKVEEDSYRCICANSRKGGTCDELKVDQPLSTPVDSSYMPMFAGDSFIERPSLDNISRISTRLDIEVVFYTYQLEGLLFYNAQSTTGKGDFIALNIRNGYLDFMYNLGQGTVHIRSETKISLNQWHTVVVSRLMKVGDLVLDNNPKVKGESPNDHTQLNLGQPLYIGAVPESVRLPGDTSITNGLMGAIQKFIVNGVRLSRSLMDAKSRSFHVQAFNGHACYRQPCRNNGSCIPVLGNYVCECKTRYSGPTCSAVEEIADDMPMEQDPNTSILLDGSTLAAYNNSITRKITSSKSTRYELQLRTTAAEGLIFCDADPSMDGDYIVLAITRGSLHLVYNFGSGPSDIVTTMPVNDGTWKNVKIVRKRHEVSIQVNDGPRLTRSWPVFGRKLNTDGILWIGGCGHENLSRRHQSLPTSLRSGFVGCLGHFRVDDHPLLLQTDALNRPRFEFCGPS